MLDLRGSGPTSGQIAVRACLVALLDFRSYPGLGRLGLGRGFRFGFRVSP